VVEVEDPENLPEDFIQRLKWPVPPIHISDHLLIAVSRDRAHRSTVTVQFRPVDMHQVDARLLEVSPDKEAPRRSSATRSSSVSSVSSISSVSTAPTLPYNEEGMQSETEAYNALVNDGGRPSHPLNLLEDIVKNPGE
jgi:hypothetical protein